MDRGIMEPKEKVLITIDDVIEDIQHSLNQDEDIEDGLTAQEIADRLEIGLKKAQKLIKKAVQAGKLEVKRVRIVDVTSRWNYTFKYGPKRK